MTCEVFVCDVSRSDLDAHTPRILANSRSPQTASLTVRLTAIVCGGGAWCRHLNTALQSDSLHCFLRGKESNAPTSETERSARWARKTYSTRHEKDIMFQSKKKPQWICKSLLKHVRILSGDTLLEDVRSEEERQERLCKVRHIPLLVSHDYRYQLFPSLTRMIGACGVRAQPRACRALMAHRVNARALGCCGHAMWSLPVVEQPQLLRAAGMVNVLLFSVGFFRA